MEKEYRQIVEKMQLKNKDVNVEPQVIMNKYNY